ncbi:unnamed protein product [Rotaria magnacalcarata]|uniref:Glycosyltransferase 61 catalytic domain-containing protein n=1 Tax=Rotaria magnacalcarata TaxID=392030 RepID=A0A820JSM9_9BILA|nr:unnamed protein product [Rotaria magnacalcarata]CAF4332433.1 unnamed protein product [Rotaria magnacalcarata]
MFVPRGIGCGGAPPSLLEQIHVKALNFVYNRSTPPKPYLSLPLPIVLNKNHNITFQHKNVTRVKAGPIIIISRSITRPRHLKNEMEIMHFLSKEYSAIPVVFFLSNISLIDTIAMFNSARVVIAPHGAGQIHLLWMRQGTAIIEISPAASFNGCFQPIATYRQVHSYIYFDPHASGRGGLQVNMTNFSQFFREVMQGRY